METPAGLDEVCSSTARDEFTSTFLAYTFYTKLVLTPLHQRVYPTDIYRACDTCQDVNTTTITMHQANRDTMEAVVKALKSYRVKNNETRINPNWVLTVGSIFDDSPGMRMRFFPGKVESFDKETTRAQAWSLHEQIEYAQDYITARNRTIAYLHREKEIAMLECKASELNKFIEAVRAGNGPPGVSFTTQGTSVFEAPSINEHRAWAGAMVDQLRSYSDTVSKLRGECKDLQQQQEAACAKSAEQDAAKKNRTIVLKNRLSQSSDAAGRGIKQSRNTCHSLQNNMVDDGNKSIQCITTNDGVIELCRRNSMPA
ncbi:hypothetical protein IMZ48_37000, partial [Candidatus Bathyarchaeota archaeon]|nr:hypothetical protein [Candidatus Bathyarchaeota archaeon]